MNILLLPLLLSLPQQTSEGAPFPRLALSAPAEESSWSVEPIQDGGFGASYQSAGRFGKKAAPVSFGFNVAAHGRLSLPFGAAGDVDAIVIGNTVIVFDHLRYNELFDPGFGASTEVDILFATSRGGHGAMDSDVRVGGYAALQGTWFDGQKETDEFGNSIEPEEMVLYSVLAGIKVAGRVSSTAFGELRIGFGMTRYEEVTATLRAPGGPGREETLIEQSERFTFESRMHGGVRFGPIAFVAGMGVRAIAGAESASNSVVEFDPQTLWILDFEVGIEIGF